MFRRLFFVVIGLLVVLAAAVVIAPMVVPASTIKAQVVRQAFNATGRELAIDGDLDVTVAPRLGVRMAGVSLANAPGFSDAPMATLEELRVGVSVLSLLRGEIKVKELVLVRPAATLEARADGSNNWTFAAPGADGAAGPAPTTSPDEPFRREPGALPFNVALGDVRIVEGSARFIDAASGAAQEATDINLSVAMPALDQTMAVRGDLALNGEPVDLSIELDSLKSFFDGDEAAAQIRVESPLARITTDGAFAESADIAFTGEVSVDIPSLRQLAAATGAELPPSGVAGVEVYERVSISGTASGDPESVAFSDARIAFDDLEGTGDLQVALSGPRPVLNGRLDMGVIDITPYAPAAPESETGAGGASGGAEPAPLPPWSDDPLDLSALTLADVQFDMGVEGLVFGDITLGEGRVAVALADGRLTAALQRLDAYEGALSGEVSVNAAGATPQFGLDLTLEGVQAGPLLSDAAGFTRAEGQADMTMEVAGRGRSMAALMNGLSGAGAFTFTDGRIRGVNLNEAASAIEQILDGRLPDPRGFGSDQSTDFSALSGTFAIADGIARTTDLALENPVIVMEGEGVVDLGDQRVDLRLSPRLIAAPRSDLADIPVPLRISGPWNDVSTGLDNERAQSLLGDYLQGEVRRAVGGAVQDALGSLFDN